MLAKKSPSKPHDVGLSLAKWRKSDCDHGQLIVEILKELSFSYRLSKINARGCNHASINLRLLFSSNLFENMVSHNPKKSHL